MVFTFSCRKKLDYSKLQNLKQRRSLNSSSESACCSSRKSVWKKDVTVINPQKIHFSKKIIVGEPFRKLLRALYRDHPKEAEVIDGKFNLSKKKAEDGDDKVSIYNIEGKTDAEKNRTITELRKAILKLLDNLRKRAKFPRGTKNIEHEKRKENIQKAEHKLPEVNNFRTPVEPKDTATASNVDENISAKRANQIDLLNFIERMKSVEGVQDDESNKLQMFKSMNGMDMNGFNGITNPTDMMSPSSNLMAGLYSQDENNYFPGNGFRGMNVEEQRKRIEDQMENNLAQLQMKFKLLQQQQEEAPVQNLHNDQMAAGLQYAAAPYPTGVFSSDGLKETAMLNQAQTLSDVNPYFPMNRPLPRFTNLIPFFTPRNLRSRSPLSPYNEDVRDIPDDYGEDDDSDEEDYGRDLPPSHYPEDEEADDEDDEEGTHYGPEDRR